MGSSRRRRSQAGSAPGGTAPTDAPALAAGSELVEDGLVEDGAEEAGAEGAAENAVATGPSAELPDEAPQVAAELGALQLQLELPPAAEEPPAKLVAVGELAPVEPATVGRAGHVRRRVVARVCAGGYTIDGHRREDWQPGEVGDFYPYVVDSAEHCFAEE